MAFHIRVLRRGHWIYFLFPVEESWQEDLLCRTDALIGSEKFSNKKIIFYFSYSACMGLLLLRCRCQKSRLTAWYHSLSCLKVITSNAEEYIPNDRTNDAGGDIWRQRGRPDACFSFFASLRDKNACLSNSLSSELYFFGSLTAEP